jgi:hypothetical protein
MFNGQQICSENEECLICFVSEALTFKASKSFNLSVISCLQYQGCLQSAKISNELSKFEALFNFGRESNYEQ